MPVPPPPRVKLLRILTPLLSNSKKTAVGEQNEDSKKESEWARRVDRCRRLRGVPDAVLGGGGLIGVEQQLEHGQAWPSARPSFFAGTPSPPVLKRLLNGEGMSAK